MTKALTSWCQWEDFTTREREMAGNSATYDRFVRTHGMLQDLGRSVREQPGRAKELLSLKLKKTISAEKTIETKPLKDDTS